MMLGQKEANKFELCVAHRAPKPWLSPRLLSTSRELHRRLPSHRCDEFLRRCLHSLPDFRSGRKQVDEGVVLQLLVQCLHSSYVQWALTIANQLPVAPALNRDCAQLTTIFKWVHLSSNHANVRYSILVQCLMEKQNSPGTFR